MVRTADHHDNSSEVLPQAQDIEAYVVTSVGRVRENNEDNYNLCGRYKPDTAVKDAKEGISIGMDATPCIFSVCDGMGGEQFGEYASLCAVSGLHAAPIGEIQEQAAKDIDAINVKICEKTKKEHARIGTTLAVLYLDHESAITCNIGDTRIYLLRKGRLIQLTVDHTEAQNRVNLGLMEKAEADRSRYKHILTQNVGIDPKEMTLSPHFSGVLTLKAGDLFLLCSDGVTDMEEDADIREILARAGSAKEAAEALVRTANDRGGHDNVTALVVRILHTS